MKTEENGDDSIFLCQRALSPIKELDEDEDKDKDIERRTSVDCDSGSS